MGKMRYSGLPQLVRTQSIPYIAHYFLDSDFIHLPATDREPEEMMDLSANSSAGSRFNFNIRVNRDHNHFELSDGEDEGTPHILHHSRTTLCIHAI